MRPYFLIMSSSLWLLSTTCWLPSSLLIPESWFSMPIYRLTIPASISEAVALALLRRLSNRRCLWLSLMRIGAFLEGYLDALEGKGF